MYMVEFYVFAVGFLSIGLTYYGIINQRILCVRAIFVTVRIGGWELRK